MSLFNKFTPQALRARLSINKPHNMLPLLNPDPVKKPLNIIVKTKNNKFLLNKIDIAILQKL